MVKSHVNGNGTPVPFGTDKNIDIDTKALRARSAPCEHSPASGHPEAPAGTAAAATRDNTYIRAIALLGFSEFVLSRGGNPFGMLECAGIDLAALSMPDMLVSFARASALLEIAALELGIDSLGLEWARTIPAHFPNAGPVLLLKNTTGTFGGWLEQLTGYWRRQTNAVAPLIIDEGDAVTVRTVVLESMPPVPRQHMEYIAGLTTLLFRAVAMDRDLDPVRIRFSHARPEDISVHERLFRCPLEFGAGRNEILFHRDILARVIRAPAKNLEAIADGFLRDRIGLLPRYTPSVATSTALAVKTVLGAGVCSKEFVAVLLGSSPRKLQRLLAGEGTTYEEVLDLARRDMASQFLADAVAPISAIAGMLDFASAAALTLAVKRWTGMTPSAYRAKLRAMPGTVP